MINDKKSLSFINRLDFADQYESALRLNVSCEGRFSVILRPYAYVHAYYNDYAYVRAGVRRHSIQLADIFECVAEWTEAVLYGSVVAAHRSTDVRVQIFERLAIFGHCDVVCIAYGDVPASLGEVAHRLYLLVRLG